MKFVANLVLSLLLFVAMHANASTTVTAIVPAPPGGAIDIAMAHLQKYLQEKKNMKIVFTYKPGGDTLIGARELDSSPKNGSVVGFFTIVGIATAKKNGIDFDYVSATRRYFQLFVVHPKTGMKTYKDFLANVSANNNFGYSGSTQLLQYNQLMEFENIKNRPGTIPYKGGAPLVNDLIGGHVDMAIMPIPVVKKHVDDKKLTVIASTAPIKEYGNIPNLAKKHPAWMDVSGVCIIFPKGTDKNVVANWRTMIKEYLEDPETIKQFAEEYSERYPFGESFLASLIAPLK